MNKVVYHLVLSLSLSATVASARHVDIVPYYELDGAGNRTLSVGSYDLASSNDGSQSIERNVILFTGGAGVTPFSLPGQRVNADPGWSRPVDFNSPLESFGTGANYPAGTLPSGYGSLGFDVVVDPRLGRNLSYWNGVGTPSFGPVPNGEVLDLYKVNPLGPPLPGNLVTLRGEANGKSGFTITPQGGGLHPNFHEHTAAALWGNATYDADDVPTEGFYLYSRTLTITNEVLDFGDHIDFVAGTQTSPVFHTLLSYDPTPTVIYEQGDFIYQYQLNEDGSDYLYDEEGDPLLLLDEFGNPVPELDEYGHPRREIIERYPALEAAVNWVNANLQPVPEPGSMSLIVIGVILACGLRRRYSKVR